MRQEGEIILDNSRIRIYELKYDLYDLVDKYKMRRVIFPNQNISQRHKQNITREAVMPYYMGYHILRYMFLNYKMDSCWY